jgi:DNA-binding response OmpR family regulator
MRALVVEDHAALAGQVITALAEAGFVADHAADGEEGHFLGETEPYDAVVLGSRPHSLIQKMTVAARVMALKKVCAQRS